MKYLCILLTLLSGCSAGKVITANKFVEPPVVSQPDIVEPISVVFDEHAPPEVEHVNGVFLNLTLLVILICVLSILPILFTYLRARWDRRSTDLDTE